ncbi:MAG: hypothetical protein OXG46_04435 [Chloroflexi bacterium]|nr:hypothetical protein [Chloroflexota bacterium]MCY3938592.1 hypothetical protein [Chloroflexota bacterium]
MNKIIRWIRIGLALLTFALVAFVVAAAVFWNVMSFVLATLYLVTAALAVLLALAFGGYVVKRRSRL